MFIAMVVLPTTKALNLAELAVIQANWQGLGFPSGHSDVCVCVCVGGGVKIMCKHMCFSVSVATSMPLCVNKLN